MKIRVIKITALLLVAVFAACLLASCAPNEAKAGVDLEEQRAEFTRTASSRLTEEASGVSPQSTRETDGDLLIAADCPVVETNATVSADLQSYVDNEIANFRAEAQDMGTPDETTGLFALTLTYKPYPIGTEVLGVKFTESAYTGKTDKKNYIDSFVYNLATGERMGLTDVFDASQDDYLTTISETVRQYLLENEIVRKNMQEDLFQNGTAANLQNFSNFVLTPDNQIVFFFNKNTVAPGEAGTLEVCVPLSEFDSILNPQNREILFGKVVERTSAAPIPEDGAQPEDGTATADGQAGTAQPVDLSRYPQFNLGDEYMLMMSLDGIDPINDKVVAITFDDGPSKETPRLLDGLKQLGVPATFFLVGNRVQMPEFDGIVARAYQEGHEICAHSYDHTSTDLKWSHEQIMDQISKANDEIQAVTGKRTTMDRPTEGAINKEVAAGIGRQQILWDVDSLDWDYRRSELHPDGEQKCYDTIMNSVKDGSIILMHDLYGFSVDMALRVIPELQAQGYKFVTVSQMIQIAVARGNEIDSYVYGSNAATRQEAPADTQEGDTSSESESAPTDDGSTPDNEG